MSRHLPFMQPLMPLQPDRPASSYQLSLSEFQHSRLKFKMEQSRVQELLQQIDQLSAILRKKEEQHQKDVFKHRQQILLMGIQIMRVRAINSQYANTLRSTKDQWKNLENIYSLKFEQLKQNLRKEFQAELQQTKAQTKNQIQKMRQLYIEKINTIMIQQRQRQQQLYGKSRQVQDKIVKIDVYELKINQAESKIKILTRKVNQYEQNIESVMQQSKFVASKLQNQKKSYQQQIASLSSRNSQLNNLKDELHQQIISMKENLQNQVRQLQDEISKFQDLNRQKVAQNQKLKYKCYTIQTELNQFKNRKTQHRESGGRRIMGENYKQREAHQYDSPKTQQKIVSNQIKKEIKLQQANNKIQELQQKIQRFEEQLQQKDLQIEQQNSQIVMLSNAISQKQNTISQKQIQIQKIQSLVSEKDKQIQSLKQKVKQAMKQKNKQKQTIQKISKSIPPQNNSHQKDVEAQKRAKELEELVQSLNSDWGLKQRNQNGIYREIQSTYLDQIERLKTQNKELQEMIENQKVFIESMARAKANQSQDKGKKKK